MAMGYERGWFKYGDKIAQHWPEFAQKGKVSCHNVLFFYPRKAVYNMMQ